jgi:hypothetical protein
MKKWLMLVATVALLSLFTSACVIPYSRNVANQNLSVSGVKVEKTSLGYYAFGIWKASDPEPVPLIMYQMATEHGCSRLDNADIDYWQTNYFFVGVMKVKVTATCVKG